MVPSSHYNQGGANRIPHFSDFIKARDIHAHEGPQLRGKREHDKKKRESGTAEPIEFVEELIGKHEISIGELRGLKYIFNFPLSALVEIDEDYAHVRKQGGLAGLVVCKPPHIFIDEARRFAIYSEDYFVVPARQIGIAGNSSTILKALALYLKSLVSRHKSNNVNCLQYGTISELLKLLQNIVFMGVFRIA